VNIVETKDEIQDFLRLWETNPSLLIPVWTDLERHPITNPISFLYVRIEGESYILPFNHTDCLSIQIDLSNSTQPKWVWDKKSVLQTELGLQNLHDIQTHYFFSTNNLYPNEYREQPFIIDYNRKGIKENLGKNTPIMKWGEYLDTLFQDLPIIPNTDKNWVDKDLIPILSELEKSPIRVVTQKFLDRWPNSQKHLYNNEYVFTQYNPYTVTSRPSNRHGGINFSAIPKDHTREIFIPREDHLFLQFDYDAYHVRIIGKLIGYDLPTTSVHQWLADQYGVSYDDSKGRTFRILYGGVSDEDRQIPFFQKVDEFIHTLWEGIQSVGYLQTGKGRRIPLSWVENPTPQKVFNYLLQGTETEYNISVLKGLMDKNLPLPLLYTYDSFLFDYGGDWGTEKAMEIKSVLESFGFPTKVSWGRNYSQV